MAAVARVRDDDGRRANRACHVNHVCHVNRACHVRRVRRAMLTQSVQSSLQCKVSV